jgi:crotonobetainyl-CoA:carnitine CoA-transferase CaiB-like acyl-CoA transferase
MPSSAKGLESGGLSEILSGVKVLDLTRVAAGPWCTQLLADMGAEVYKMERPGTGDDSRSYRPFVSPPASQTSPSSAFFLALNRGKKSITVDIGNSEGADLVREMAAKCDIFIENYKAGSLAKYGLDYESIRAINPGIVYCSVTGFGQSGPHARRPAYDSIMQATAGLMSMCGDPAGDPQRTAIAIADLTTGYCAAVSVLGAYIHRMRTGEGQHLDTAMLDASVALTAQYASAFLLTGEVPLRAGNRAPNTYPSGVFTASDRQMVVVCGNDRQFASLCRLLKLDGMSADPRFTTNIARRENHVELGASLNAEFAKRPAHEWADLLEDSGVPSAPINQVSDVFDDPQVIHRKLRIEIEQENGDPIPVVRSPLNFSLTPVQHRPAPALGQDTAKTLHELLGKSCEEIERLRAAGAI